MKKDPSKVEIDTLASFFPLCHMTHDELNLLSDQVTLLRGKKGKCLVECGASDNKTVFVVEGNVKLESGDGHNHMIEQDTPQSKSPISCTSPHKYTVTCLNTVYYFRVDNHVIENLLERNDTSTQADNQNSFDQQLLNNQLFNIIYKDLIKDDLVIPTLPKIAMGVKRAIEQDLPVRKIEMLIQADPALASLLVKTANSALYRTRNSASTIEQSIIRLGLNVVKQLVTGYSLKNLFTTNNKSIKTRMKDLWIHSAEVAAVCFVLARHLRGFDAEHALLLGLLHNVGVLPILGYAERCPDVIENDDKLDATINNLKAEIGSIILTKWQFSEDFVSVARESENWQRDDYDKADYCDIVLVAKLHTFIGRESSNNELPQLYEIPAFQKLGLDKNNPGKGLSILADANDQIATVRQLLSI